MSEKKRVWKIETRYVGGLISLLRSLVLKGPNTRHRSKFIRLLEDPARDMEVARNELIDRLVPKDEKGRPKAVPGGGFNFDTVAQSKEYDKEMSKLMDGWESLDVDLDSRKVMFESIGKLFLGGLEGCKVAKGGGVIELEGLYGQEADSFDAACDAFEDMN